MGGRASKQKGDRFERECVKALVEAGIQAERVPLSGAAGGSYTGDLTLMHRGELRRIECKMRHRAWLDLYGWLADNFALFIRRNRDETLVVLRMRDFVKLVGDDWTAL